jgi:hypothetical protein
MKTFSLANLEDVGNARLTGETLAMKVRKMSPAQRAALAVRLQYCDVSIVSLLPRQAAALTNVAIGSVRLAGNATEADVTALKRGLLSLNGLRRKYRKPPSDNEIETFINSVGAADVLRVLDAMTAPAPMVAAAE